MDLLKKYTVSYFSVAQETSIFLVVIYPPLSYYLLQRRRDDEERSISTHFIIFWLVSRNIHMYIHIRTQKERKNAVLTLTLYSSPPSHLSLSLL